MNWLILVFAGLLSLAMKSLPVGTAYAVWVGIIGLELSS